MQNLLFAALQHPYSAFQNNGTHLSSRFRIYMGSERTRPEIGGNSAPFSFVSIAMKKLYSALVLSALALLAAGQSQANPAAVERACGKAPQAPALIEGKSANEPAMRQTAASVRGFAKDSISYLTCLDSHPVSSSYLSQPSYRASMASLRDQAADRLEVTVNSYNAELRAFKAQQSQVAATN